MGHRWRSNGDSGGGRPRRTPYGPRLSHKVTASTVPVLGGLRAAAAGSRGFTHRNKRRPSDEKAHDPRSGALVRVLG